MISVCITTYNGVRFIEEQLISILNQLSVEDEIIISDDSSTDNTIELIERLSDKRIRILKGNTFKSPVYNLENALKNANGDYIFLSDQDDIWLENKVQKMIEILLTADMVVSDCFVVDKDKNIISNSFFEIRNSGNGFWRNLWKNTYLGCCVAFRKEVLEYILPFPKKLPMHDTWIGLNVDIRGKVVFVPEPLILYRRHGENASSTSSSSNRSLFRQMIDRFIFLFAVLRRRLQYI